MIRSNSASFFDVIGRLRADASPARAESELEAIHRGYLAELGRSNDERAREYHIQLEPASHGGGRLRTQFAKPIWILLALMIGVLTIACRITHAAAALLGHVFSTAGQPFPGSRHICPVSGSGALTSSLFHAPNVAAVS